MAAYAALVSVMQIIHEIENHPSPPIHLDKQQVQSLTTNVTFLQNFLEAYNSPVADGDEADPLDSRIANAAYAAEDVIDSFILDVSRSSATATHDQETDSGGEDTTSSSGEGNEGSSEETRSSSNGEEVSCIKLYEDLHQVIEEMHLIKMKIEAEKAVIRDQLQPKMKGSTDHGGSLRQWKDSINMMVGFDDVLLEVLDKLVGSQLKNRQVIPISGMGGIGKTTLARTVYSKPLITEHFDICAWATISQQYDSREILCEVLSHTTYINKEEVSERGEDEVGSELYKTLFGRRFLIVMDDMWSIDAWDKVQRFFPENENGSRILVTTRLSQLSSQLTNSYSLSMKFLDEASSWDLFSKTVFGENNCPRELEEVGKKIVENCIGLPLSIVVVGGLLRKMEDTVGCWESIWWNLSSMVNLENDKHCFKLLKMSYNHLPVYLKPCFLYMGVFEEDDEIGVSELIKLWVSEGFLKPRSGKSLETIGRERLNELVDRNLILPHKVGRTGNIKKCKIHDLLRDLCLTEAQRYGFYHVIGHEYSSKTTIHAHRRVVIPSDTSEEEISDELQSMSHTRSIICDDDDKVMACRSSQLLRTLNASNNYVDESDGSPLVFGFVNLRHVIVELYSKLSISHLWNLQTLIVSCWHECNAPVGIWKMRQLRHIEFREHRLHLPDPPRDGDVIVMENLQTLKGVENFKCGEEVVKRIPNITRLLVKYDKVEGKRSRDDYYCVTNIESLSRLESLTYIEGTRIRRVQKLTFPHSVKKLTLTMSYDDDMLEKIGSLPHLQKLKMVSGSFTTGKWEIGEGQFPCLKSLTLMWCHGLKHWTAAAEERYAVFPCLEQLYLSGLTGLEEIPYEIGEIPTLETIELINCSESVVERAREMVDEQECYGEVSFRVSVVVSRKFEALKSLATPGFEVEVTDYV